MGRASARARSALAAASSIGPRPLPPGQLLGVLTAYDPMTGTYHRYDIYKSPSGRRRVDVVVDRDRQYRRRSITWLMGQLRSKMATLPELQAD